MEWVNSRAGSEMNLDLRTADELEASKYGSDLASVNNEYSVFKSEPLLISRQLHEHDSFPAIYHLKA